ncbi:MAG TPA: glycoside hydrolase [Polyangiaceae bacterium]|nr:glycoside hydrolase [Polyangiaceae bacterium]
MKATRRILARSRAGNLGHALQRQTFGTSPQVTENGSAKSPRAHKARLEHRAIKLIGVLAAFAGLACEATTSPNGESQAGATNGGASGGGTTSVVQGGARTNGGTNASGGTTNAAGGADGKGGSATSGGTSTSGGSPSGGNSTSGGAGRNAGGTVGSSGSGGQSGSASGGAPGGSGGRPQVKAESGATLVKVDPNTKRQSFEGWGSSICWWGDRVGGWAEDKRNALVDLIVDAKNGLGYNIFRYNIGGGENPAHTHMGEHRDMPGFEPSKGTWDWNADARQQAVLKRLLSSGQNIILEAFSNSPPYWMTKSGCASGSSDGSDNLKDDQYDAFADYLTEVVKHYHDELGVTFRTLEPLNEPNANWWKSNGGQEGCHFGPSNQQRIIKAVGAALASKGLTGTTVSASDENSMDDAYNNVRGFDSTTLGYMSQLNTHSYAGTKRAEVRALATDKKKRLWQSESGPLSVDLANEMEAAIFMAGRIILDLRELQPNAWIDWQLLDTSPTWTSFVFDDKKQSFTPNKRFYMHSGFSRYIRPGATFVSIDNADMVAALSSDEASVTIVVRNGDKSATRKFTFDLTRLPVLPASVEVYRTSSSENLAHLDPMKPGDWSFTATMPASSVTTFVLALK